MGGDNVIITKDYVEHVEMSPEDRDKEIQRLKEESEKMTEWPVA